MASPLSNLADQWQKLTATQRLAIGIAALVLMIIGGVAISMSSGPKYTRLYGNLTDEDADAVVQQLKTMKVPYRIEGNDISVPAEKVDETRITLAGEGIPQGGNVGFELFDKTQLGQSEFGEQMTYLRALQGELKRSIQSLDCVREARVHLVIPKDRLYTTEKESPSASVVLALRRDPTPQEVKAVTHLVASAVEGLTPEKVTVVDTEGRTLSDMTDLASDVNNAVRMQAQRNEEERIRDRVQAMLDKVLGPGKAVVSATVTMNFDKTKVDRDIYTPVTQGGTVSGPTPHGVLQKQYEKREAYNGSKSVTVAGGPGIVPNTSGLNLGGNNNNNSNNYTNAENTAEYMVSKEEQHIEQTPGKIERVTLGLFLDDTIDAQQITDMSKTLEAAAGLVPGRDTIQLMSMSFDKTADEAAKKAEDAQKKDAQRQMYIKYGLAGLLILVFAFIILAIYRSILAPSLDKGTMPLEQSTALDMLPPVDEVAELYAAEQRQGVQNNPMDELPMPEESPVVTLDPKRLAQVIKGMLAED